MLAFDARRGSRLEPARAGKQVFMDGTAVALDAFALLLAGWVLGCRGAARWQRCVAAFASLAFAVTSPVLMPAGSAPEWTRIVAVCAMFLAFWAVAAVVSAIGGTPDDDGSGGLTGGDWDPSSPEAPPGGTDDSDPDWWPEFERDFANYVAQSLPPLRRETHAPLTPLTWAPGC